MLFRSETGVWFISDNYDDLIKKIEPHRSYKNLPLDTIHSDVQRQLCAGLTTTECQPEPGENYRPVKDLTTTLTTAKAISLTKSVAGILAEVASGRSALCDKTEAAARADICRRCPFNRSANLCSCSAVYKAIEAAIPKDRRYPDISVCAACGCSLQAKVNLPLGVIKASNSPEVVFPAWCWQHPDTPLNGAGTSDTTG